MRSIPISALITNTMKLVEDNTRGKTPRKPALPPGKRPFMESSPRTKTYKVHMPSLANAWPPLDKDAAKVDSNPNSFQTVSIERSAFHQLAESCHHSLCTISLHDWFTVAASQHAKDKDPSMYDSLLEAAAKCTTFNAEVMARMHMSFLLMECDAWLDCPSVHLSTRKN